MTWKPIETAPKNGIDLLLYQFEPCTFAPGHCIYIGFHLIGKWTDSEGFEYNPTHWMELPSPPVKGV
jgi:hypothetical protein